MTCTASNETFLTKMDFGMEILLLWLQYILLFTTLNSEKKKWTGIYYIVQLLNLPPRQTTVSVVRCGVRTHLRKFRFEHFEPRRHVTVLFIKVYSYIVINIYFSISQASPAAISSNSI